VNEGAGDRAAPSGGPAGRAEGRGWGAIVTALLAMPTTVAYVLGAHDPAVLARALRDGGVARHALAGTERLAASAYRSFDERVGRVLHQLLELDLGELVVDGWAGRADLADAVVRTRMGRAETEVVLADHRITSTHQPAVDVLAGGVAVTALRFDVVVRLRLRGVVALIRGGLLAAVLRGQLTAEAELTLDGRRLLAGNGRGAVRSVLRLGDGLVLPGVVGPDREPDEGAERGSTVLHLPIPESD
jgi:hypothetical protein